MGEKKMAGLPKPDSMNPALRQRAEAAVSAATETPPSLSPQDAQRMLHELQVHQIELEMQNEELLRTHRQLDAECARYVELYDLAPVGYCTLSDTGLILQANLGLATLLGIERASLNKLRMAQFILQEDQELYYALRNKLASSGQSQSCELRVLRTGAAPVWVQLAVTSVLGEAAKRTLRVVISDIGDRKRMELERQRNLIEWTREATAVVRGGVVVYANHAAVKMLGASSPDELLGRNIRHFVQEDAQAAVLERFRKLPKNDLAARIFEEKWLTLEGAKIDLEVQRMGIVYDDAPAVQLAMRDITDRKFLDRVLQQHNLELAEARSAAEKANLAKSEFVSSMSHELRTPLNAILGFAQLMEAGSPAPTPGQQRNLGQILKAGWHLLELVNEILDLSLIESGKFRMSLEPISVDQIMLECQAMMESQAEAHDVTLKFQTVAGRIFVNADRIRLKQVLLNLLSNAVKYNQPGGTVAVECTSSADALRISIRDSGAGLTPAQQAQLFQPFNRLGKEAGKEEGTGIGLVVTKRLVEMMGGSIGVDSVVGVGSLFWIELKRASAPQPIARDAPELPTELPPGSLQRTVLYVEDNPANLELIEQLMARRSDLRLLSAADATLGIELARQELPQVILLDINLPGLSGMQALKILHCDTATAHIPVIALSANAQPLDITHGLAAGFFDYLTKPIKIQEFMHRLDLALEFSAKERLRTDAA